MPTNVLFTEEKTLIASEVAIFDVTAPWDCVIGEIRGRHHPKLVDRAHEAAEPQFSEMFDAAEMMGMGRVA